MKGYIKMAKHIKKSTSRFISLMIAVALLVGMIPISTLPSVFAAFVPTFTVEMDSAIRGDISITLTNSENPAETKTEPVMAGVAEFSDFVNLDNPYDVKITGMIGYEDYYKSGVFLSDASISFNAVDFEQLDFIVVSGQITDENGTTYIDGGTIFYSGYDSGSVALAGDGSFIATIYKNKSYDFYFTPTNPVYSSVSLGTVNSLEDITNLNAQLSIKTFSITTTASAIGTISPSESSIPYGSNRSITATANSGYIIAIFTVDGTTIPEAIGLETYTYPLDNINDNHTVNVTFAIKTYEVVFTFNSYGTIKDDLFNNINSGGKITANEGTSPSFTANANENYHISSVIIDDEQTDGIFDNAQTSYSHTFTNISANHSVTVMFSINIYSIKVSCTENGSVTGGSQTGSTQYVSHGESLALTLTPETGYDVKEVLLDGMPVDEYTLLADGVSYSYIISSVAADHNVSVTFSLIETISGDEREFYDLAAESLINEYPIVSDSIRIYSFINNGASVTLMPKAPYSIIRINGSVHSASVQLTSSTLIDKIEVYKSSSPGKGWKAISIQNKLRIIIDKNAPVVADIPPMEWTNQDYTINGTVMDEDTANAPSSGLLRVVWSKTALTKDQALAEATNIVPVTSGRYSLTITTEQNNEKYYFYAVDKAENVSDAKTIDVKIDKTVPEITQITFQKREMPVVSEVINFLTFGTFFNDEIEVVITAQDPGISSGLKEITLYGDSVAVETKTVTGASAVFKLTLENFNRNEISASVKDIAGNDSANDRLTKPTDVMTNAFSNIVSLKTEKPTISIAPMSKAIYTNGGENWYNGNVGFTVNASTESGGIYSVVIKVNGQNITTDKNGKAIDANFFESQTLQETFTVNTDYNPLDGENNIEVIVTNNYGNKETASIKVFIDTTNPKVVGFKISTENDGTLSDIFNFLTFGSFFNEKVKITVVADDRYGATSGISTITLYAEGKLIYGSPKVATKIDHGIYKAEFILPESIIPNAKLLDVGLTAVAIDNVTNITGKDEVHPYGVPVTAAAVNSDLKNSRLMIETINPIINISSPKPVFIDSGNRKWYSGDVPVTVNVNDMDSGIRSVRIKINGVEITTCTDGKPINADFYIAEMHGEVFRISTSQGAQAIDGSYLIEVSVIDNAGNVYSLSDTVYKDIGSPTITSYSFIPTTSDGISKTSEFIGYLEYGFYFKTEFNAVIHVSDPGPSSGLDKVSYRLVSYQNGTITGETNGTQTIADGMAAITIPKGFKGQIFVKAFDNTDNKSNEEKPRGFVSDDTAPKISIRNNNSTNYNDADGNKLYVSDMSFTVAISDYSSGIKEIGYSQSAEKESFERKSILIKNTGYSIGDTLENGWTVSEMDSNLVTKVTKTFPFSSDDNNIILTFDATDSSGNKEGNIRTEKMTIDKTTPIINVEFRSDESKNNYYYSTNRVADVTVIERNFDSDLVIAAIENKFGKVPTFSFSNKSKTEHVAVIDFDEGDYIFDVSGTDLGNHVAVVNFSGGNEKLFYVDKTKPGIEDNFATFSNSATNNSFNTDKTATIKITDHNFDPKLVDLKISGKDAGGDHNSTGFVDITPEISGSAHWESVGDVHTISLTFSKDAVYKIEMCPKDLAENSTDLRSTTVFEIDQTVPVVKSKNGTLVSENNTKFVDVYPYSRKDALAPIVEFSDLNIDHINYDLKVYIPDHTSKDAITVIKPVKVYLDEDKYKHGVIKGNIFNLPNFTKDGVYALELTAVDAAGNESLLNLNTYARMIKQDVLAYIIESNLAAKTGLYSFQYENGDAISKRPDNFSDIKICMFAKKDTGIDVVLRDNNADEVNTKATGTSDDSIYGFGIHNFILKSNFFKENFQDDTDIELHLSAKNEGNRIDLGTMHIDNIAPTCEVPEEFNSWHWYYGEEERTITISNISELIDENRSKVYDNGKEVGFKYLSGDNTLSFKLEKGWHNVGIILADMAGNVNNVQEKANIHIGFFWLWIIIASSAALITVIVFVAIRNIRKKLKLEND
ncbi:hypothetical protein CLHUN_40980 [Ruminiclostridium hungatei]|uniref:Bacterial repeat domain-containing protein n=1 Tax=Ruminiclostridium hungatei TaxID=48256 RepID=A0A1V4SDP3_RUMHU|nr:hypothetical protein [Ruminiclostridium hungatei]OPX42039.1 hypothetical protein CLHUN_40980 [Ruminiclostridium hungatei]